MSQLVGKTLCIKSWKAVFVECVRLVESEQVQRILKSKGYWVDEWYVGDEYPGLEWWGHGPYIRIRGPCSRLI